MKRISKLLNNQQNQLINNNFFNLLGFVIPAIVMFVFTPSLVSGLGVEDYGIWNVSLSFLGLMGVFEFGLGVSVVKYISEFVAKDDPESLSSIVTMGFIINFGLGVLIVIPLYFLAPEITNLLFKNSDSLSKTSQIIRIISLGFLPLMLRNVGLAVPAGLQKYQIVNIVKIVQNALTMIVAITVITLEGTIYDVVTGTVILMWIIGLVSLLVGYRLLQPYAFRWIISREAAKTILSYMAAAGFTNVGIKLFSSVDKLVVGAVLGLSSVTFYSIAIGIANKLVAMSSALTQALMPAASEMYTKGEHQQLRKILVSSTIVLFFLNSILVGFLLIFAEKFLVWWLDIGIASQVLVPFRILVFIYGVSGITAPAFYIANGIGRPWINTIGTMVQGIGVILLIVYLGNNYGIIGTAWANAISWVKYGIVIYIYVILKRSQGVQKGEIPLNT